MGENINMFNQQIQSLHIQSSKKEQEIEMLNKQKYDLKFRLIEAHQTLTEYGEVINSQKIEIVDLKQRLEIKTCCNQSMRSDKTITIRNNTPSKYTMSPRVAGGLFDGHSIKSLNTLGADLYFYN